MAGTNGYKGPFLVFLLLLAIIRPAAAVSATAEDQIRVYFFHGTIRCFSCLRMSSLLGEALQQNFSGLLDSGHLQWRPVNIELSGNFEFQKELGLTEHAVILVKYRQGKPLYWVKLNNLWDKVDSRRAFFGQVKESVAAFRNESR